MSGAGRRAALDAARQAIRNKANLHITGPPFQFKVRTAKSIKFEDTAQMFPHYDDAVYRVTLVPSYTTKNMDQSNREIIRLYRKICRRLPSILQDYNAFHIKAGVARKKVRDEFLKNSNVKDHRVVDRLRIKAEQTLQDYHYGRYHTNVVYRFLAPEEQHNPVPEIVRKRQSFANSKFLSDFYSGSDVIDK